LRPYRRLNRTREEVKVRALVHWQFSWLTNATEKKKSQLTNKSLITKRYIQYFKQLQFRACRKGKRERAKLSFDE